MTKETSRELLSLVEGWRLGAAQCQRHAALNQDTALGEAAKVLRECAAELEVRVLNSLKEGVALSLVALRHIIKEWRAADAACRDSDDMKFGSEIAYERMLALLDGEAESVEDGRTQND